MPGQDLQWGDSEPGGRLTRQYVSGRADMDERRQTVGPTKICPGWSMASMEAQSGDWED